MRMVCLISDVRAAASGSETRRESVTALDGETEIQENKKKMRDAAGSFLPRPVFGAHGVLYCHR